MTKAPQVYVPKPIFGFLWPNATAGQCPLGDIAAFFAAIQSRFESGRDGHWTYPLLSYDLWRGHVDAEDIDGFETQLTDAERAAAVMYCDQDDLIALGVDPGQTEIPLDAPTLAQAFAWHFKMLHSAARMIRLKLAKPKPFRDRWIRVGSTDLADSHYFRHFDRAAFFCEGPPIWLTWRKPGGVDQAFVDRHMISR